MFWLFRKSQNNILQCQALFSSFIDLLPSCSASASDSFKLFSTIFYHYCLLKKKKSKLN